MIAIPSILY